MARSKKFDVEKLVADSKGLVRHGNDEEFQFSRIQFNVPALDLLVGGGIPKKRISLFTGSPSSGKSYLASQVVASAQKQGAQALWIDTELSWDAAWMSKCGIDVEKILVSQPTAGEQAFDTIRDAMSSGIDIVVLDSIAGLVPTSVQEEDFSYNPVAWQARMVNQSLPRIVSHLSNGTALVLINQTRSTLGPHSGDNMPGGVAQTFFAHTILSIRRLQWINEKGGSTNKIGYDMKVTCYKSKVGGRIQQSVVIPFRFDGGLDSLETSLREAIAKGIILQAGPYFKYGEKSILGMNGLREYFKDREKLDSLVQEIGQIQMVSEPEDDEDTTTAD